MGQFSWLDCDMSNERCRQILDNTTEDVYVLVPKEFGGGHILETEYNGYGIFGGHDIFDLVAEWNRNYITIDNLSTKPVREDYGGLWKDEIENLKKQGYSDKEIKVKDDEMREHHFQRALNNYEQQILMLKDFQSEKSDVEMCVIYYDDWKRNLGIGIACYDYQNAGLKYPIKITHNPNLTYEEATYSLSDPNQGWIAYREKYDEHLEEYVEEIDADFGLEHALSKYDEVDKKLEQMKTGKKVSNGKTR